MQFKMPQKLQAIPESIFPTMTALAQKHNAVNLAQGFPGFDMDPELIKLANNYAVRGFNQYAPVRGVPQLREQLSNKIASCYGYFYHPETEICITAGATQAIFTAISAVVSQGDEVIIIDPAFDCYEPAITMNNATAIRSALEQDTFNINWADIKQKITPKTKLLIINTPQNPTGAILKSNDLKKLEELLENTNIILLSDEVYEHMVFDGAQHESACKYPNLVNRAFLVFSLGKTYHCTGWRTGYICAPKILMQQFVTAHQYQVYAVPTHLQHAFANYSEQQEKYLALNSYFEQKRNYFLNALKGSKWEAKPTEGTYFQLLNYKKISNENDVLFAKQLTIQNEVAAIPISVFYADKRDDKYLRFCFAKPEKTLDLAAEKLIKL